MRSASTAGSMYAPLEAGFVPDKYKMAYAIMFLQGVGMLFPWNVFITATQYFDRRLCGTDFLDNYQNFFGIAFNVSNTIGLWLTLKYQHHLTQRTRVVLPLSINTLAFFSVTAMSLIDPDDFEGGPLFAITLFMVALSGTCTALLQGGIFGLAGQLPPLYTQAVMGGQGLAGLMVAGSSMLIGAAGGEQPDNVCDPVVPYSDVKWNAFSYFLIASCVVMSCVFSYFALERLPFVRAHLDMGETTVVKTLNATGDESDNEGLKMDRTALLNEQDMLSDVDGGMMGMGGSSIDSLDDLELSNAPESLGAIYAKIKPLAISVLLVFLCTLAVFPSVTAKIRASSDSDSRFFGDLWIPFSFLMFNLWDFVGRLLAGWVIVCKNPKDSPGSARTLVFWSTLRLVFVPLFLLCNVVPAGGGESSLPLAFESDAFPIIFMILFATSNGYLGSVLMMYGPTQVNAGSTQTAGTMMVTFLTVGLMMGSFMSFAWLPLLGS